MVEGEFLLSIIRQRYSCIQKIVSGGREQGE